MQRSWWCRFKNKVCRKLGVCYELIAVGWPYNGEVPIWVVKAVEKKMEKGWGYGTFYFYGRTFIYKVEHKPDVQGGSWYWYRKKK